MNQEKFLKLHFKMAIQSIVKMGQGIDLLWSTEAHLARLDELKSILSWCQNHEHTEVQDLARHQRLIHPQMTQEQFLTVLVPLERSYSRGVVDHDLEIVEGDSPVAEERQSAPIYVVLDNIRSSFNVGSAFRTCECFGVRELYLCGYTSTPDNSKTAKTSMGTSELVPWSLHKSSLELVKELQAQGVSVFAVETGKQSQSLYEAKFPERTALVLGNERHGLSPDLIKACNGTIKIPLHGSKNSLNVGVALGSCLSELRRRISLSD